MAVQSIRKSSVSYEGIYQDRAERRIRRNRERRARQLRRKMFLFLAAVFLGMTYKKIRDYLIKKYEAEKEKDKELKEALETVRKYPEYRQQSIKIQEKLENEIQELRKAQDEHTCRLLQMEENSQRRERNKLRDRLLQNYRYYTSKEHNPRQEWTRMESETFWECFADYENMNGNGYMHSVVQPEMNLLGIIEMDDASGIAELMHSRK